MNTSARSMLGMVAALALAGGCKKSQPVAGGGAAGEPGAAVTAPAAAAIVPGMTDPFARLTSDAAKDLNAGYKALKAKKFDDARTSFASVVKAVPDYSPARFQEARAAALGGHFADVPDLWRELCARDGAGYFGRLDKAKDMAPLRASPEWAKVGAAEKDARAAWVNGLDKGFFLVARAREVAPPKFGDDGLGKIDLQQEAWHFDPATARYRRLTSTDGHLFAINVSADRKQLMFIAVTTLEREAATGENELYKPQAGIVDLTTLTATGPFALTERAKAVSLEFAATGEPRWLVNRDDAFTFDSARTALVKVPRAATEIGSEPGATVALADKVEHFGAAVTGVKRADDGLTLTVDGNPTPLRSARPIAGGSIEWSPGKKRFVYAGVLDACKIIQGEANGVKGERNELYIYDADKKVVARIASAISTFDALWLDDNRVVYEGGVGKGATLHIYDASTREDTALKSRAGAGLFGFPSLTCVEGAPVQPEDQIDDSEEGGE